MCIPKKNEKVFFVESMKLSSFFFLHHSCCREKFLDGVSDFSQPLKKKWKRMGFKGKCLVE